jgi:methanogenic corrinoid protein MtbC1
MMDLKPLYTAVLEGDAATARTLTEQAIAEGIDPQSLLSDYLTNEYFVPELLIAARAMKNSLVLIRPLLAESGAKPVGKVAIGTVRGDLHDIGKNLVAAMLEGGGFEIIDLGVDVAPDKFVAAVKDSGAQIVALSALLTTTMPGMKQTIEALGEAGVRTGVKVIIGGAPVTQKFADDIGADGFSDTASGAVRVARNLMEG